MQHKFDWDQGNTKKINNSGRNIALDEIESVFHDPYVIITEDREIDGEQRYLANGMSNQKRLISVIFVYRKGKYRPITAWKTHRGKKRREYYEQFQ